RSVLQAEHCAEGRPCRPAHQRHNHHRDLGPDRQARAGPGPATGLRRCPAMGALDERRRHRNDRRGPGAPDDTAEPAHGPRRPGGGPPPPPPPTPPPPPPPPPPPLPP